MSAVVSVIVPVYNCEKHISRCIDSIINQTYSNLELIIIDDGSTDASGRICDAYASKDVRVKVHHTLNKGVSAARNTGLKMSTGEYVMFVDADDYISLGAISVALSHMYDDDSQVVAFGYNLVKNNKVKSITENKRVSASDWELFEQCIPSKYSIYIWNKLYKKDVIIKYFNEHFRNCEDFLFNSQFFGGYLKMSVISDPLYYCQVEGNLSRHYPADYLQRLSLISGKVCRNLNVSLTDLPYFCGFLQLKTLACIKSKTKDDRIAVLESSSEFRKVLTKHAKVKGFKNKLILLFSKLGLTTLALSLIH